MDSVGLKSGVFLQILLFSALFLKLSSGDDSNEEIKVDDKAIDYAKGSVCGYCSYCKFCQLCDDDCPCESSPTQPNCKMCKYCKYCYLCKGVCDTICTAGGILDKVSAAIVNSLPGLPDHNKDEIEDDLTEVNTWIKKNRDEL